MAKIALRVFDPDEWRAYRALRLRALADSPDAFQTSYADARDRSDESWQSLLRNNSVADRDLPLVAEVDRVPGGMSWAKILSPAMQVAHVYQMWVVPEFRGLGIGRRMLETAIAWAWEHGAHAVELAVTRGNSPAVKLYESLGFMATGAVEPLRPGSDLVVQDMVLRLGTDGDVS